MSNVFGTPEYSRAYRLARKERAGGTLTPKQRRILDAWRAKGYLTENKKRVPPPKEMGGPSTGPVESVVQTDVPRGTGSEPERSSSPAPPRSEEPFGETETAKVETALPDIPHAQAPPVVDFSLPVEAPSNGAPGSNGHAAKTNEPKPPDLGLDKLDLDLSAGMRDFMKSLSENAKAGGMRVPPDGWYDGPYYKCCRYFEELWLKDLDAKKAAAVVVIGTSGVTIVQSVRADKAIAKSGKKSPAQLKFEEQQRAAQPPTQEPPKEQAPPARHHEPSDMAHLFEGKV